MDQNQVRLLAFGLTVSLFTFIIAVRHFHSAILLDDSMYVFGGIFKSSNMNDLHEFPLSKPINMS